MDPDEPMAMQTRCLACLREHWTPTVVGVSEGTRRCKCGYLSEPMGWDEYRRLLTLAIAAKERSTRNPPIPRPPRQRRPPP